MRRRIGWMFGWLLAYGGGLQPASSSEPLVAGILIENGVFNTELTAPMDVFHHTPFHAKPGITVTTIGPTLDPIVTFEGLRITPHHTYASAPKLDILVVPSAERHVSPEFDDPKLIAFVTARAAEAKYVLSLCDGAFVLAKGGLLDGRTCTTYPGDIPQLRERFAKTTVMDALSFVVDGKLITSAGGASSFDAALFLVERLYGRQPAIGVAKGLVIDWDLQRIPYLEVGPAAHAYQVGDRIDPDVTVTAADGSSHRLLDLIEPDDSLIVLFLFGGGDPSGTAHRGGLWCEDSLFEMSLMRNMRAQFEQRGATFVAVAMPPIDHEVRFGYVEGSFLGEGKDHEDAVQRHITATEGAVRAGIVPFDRVFYDGRFQLLRDVERFPRREGEPSWLGRFRADGETQVYGTPTVWVIARDGAVLQPPYYGNNYERDRELRYTSRELGVAIRRALDRGKSKD